MPVPTVHVIDDDESMRNAMVSLLRSVGLQVTAYAAADAFLQQPREAGPSCLVLDIRLPGTNGLDLQAELNRLGMTMPVVFITGHGTIPMTVRAMRAGAVEFLTKPFSPSDFVQAVRTALERDVAAWPARQELDGLRARYALLSPREREVLTHVAAGSMNKVAAARLGVTEITVKVHRRRIMEKLELRSVADLVRATERLGLRAPGGDYTKV